MDIVGKCEVGNVLVGAWGEASGMGFPVYLC